MIEIASSGTVKTSRETVWRHLTRPSDWYRWYPGLHGVDTSEWINKVGQSWRSTGQMGRMLYRGEQQVRDYQLLSCIEFEGTRYPWLKQLVTRIELEPEGPNCHLTVTMYAEPGLWPAGRLILAPLLRRRLQREANEVADRLVRYVEGVMPYH